MMKNYRITAHLLCHDVRLNTTISTIVETASEPTEAEAEILLTPVAAEFLSAPAYDCGGCPFELSIFRVAPLEQSGSHKENK